MIVTAASASSGVSRSSRQATVIASGRLGVGDVPGLKSVPSATGTPRSMNVRAGARLVLHQEPGRAGRSVATTGSARGRGRRRARRSPRPTGVARWSADSGAQLRGQLRAAATGRARRRAARTPARRPRPPRGSAAIWSAREHALLAEHVARSAPGPGRRRPGSCSSMTLPDVRLRPVRAAPGTRAGPRARRGTSGRRRPGPPRPSSWATSSSRSSVCEVEAVAGLRLDRGHAVAEHLVEPAPAVARRASSLVGRARRGDRRQDPAAGGEDLEVAGAALAEDELALARAGEQQVGVRVDEPGRDDAAVRVEPREPRERIARRASSAGLDLGRAGRPRRSGPPSSATTGASRRPGPPTVGRVEQREVALARRRAGARRRASRPATAPWIRSPGASAARRGRPR